MFICFYLSANENKQVVHPVVMKIVGLALFQLYKVMLYKRIQEHESNAQTCKTCQILLFLHTYMLYHVVLF